MAETETPWQPRRILPVDAGNAIPAMPPPAMTSRMPGKSESALRPRSGPGSLGLKVAFLVRKFPKLSETFILNQITGLIDRGVDLDIFAWEPGESDAHADVATYSLRGKTRYIRPPRPYLERVAAVSARMVRDRSWRRPSMVLRSLDVWRHGRSASSLYLLYAGSGLLHSGPHDVVHCQFGDLGATALELRAIGAVPGRIVVSFRGSDLTARDRSGDDALFQAADLVLPVCEAFAERLIGLGCDPKKIRVHRSGVDLGRFEYIERMDRQRSPDRPTRLLTVSRLVEKKGVAYGLEAVARLRASGRNVVYSILGDGPLGPELERLRDSLGLGEIVSFLGPGDDARVLACLREAHVLVAPSVTAGDGDQEGIPNALKEAMATGLPVVSTRHSGIPELVEDGISGFLVPERDADALAERVACLVDHPERWGAMGRAGRRRVEADYDSETLNVRLVELYREVCSGLPCSGLRGSGLQRRS
jgi:colanic acid/amylovoran biosynthesis glycosyltransferase